MTVIMTATKVRRANVARILVLFMLFQLFSPFANELYAASVSEKISISADHVASEEKDPAPALDMLSADTPAVESALPQVYSLIPERINPESISADDVACEGGKDEEGKESGKNDKFKTPPAQIIQYAKNFWDEADSKIKEKNIRISGTKTFEVKKAEVTGDIGHFSTENYESIPGFKLDQSLHLEIDGNINETSTVHAVLDDKDDEDRRFTINVDGPVWKFVMGDFPLALEDTEFSLFRKEVRGIMAQGSFHDRFRSIFLFSQAKGQARREQFRGAGQQQEFRMSASPIVQNSENVSIDGRKLARGTDYFIDYEDGLIKLLPHILPVEVTSWIVVEYEVSDKSLAFSRNLFGTRQIYSPGQNRHVAVTWLREVDSSAPKSGINASATATPMQHDLVSADTRWALGNGIAFTGETAFSRLDPNRNSDDAPQDRPMIGHAMRFGVIGKTEKTEGEAAYRKIDSKFKVVGREGGVLELGERGLVNDIMSGRAKLSYMFTDQIKGFLGGEKSETNLENDPTLQAVKFNDLNTGMIWTQGDVSRIEIRGGRQQDRETGPGRRANVIRDTSTAVYDRKFGRLVTQSKINKTTYDDSINVASDSEVLEMSFIMGAKTDNSFAWNAGISRITLDDDQMPDSLRSDTRNYNLDLNFEPSRVFSARGVFQWRHEDDYLANSSARTEIADSQIRYEPTRDLRTQLKYKIENTSKVIRDPDLDPQKYILPPSLPNSEKNKLEIVGRFENPVQKSTANFLTDYRINRYLQAFFDWRRRDLEDQKTKIKVSSNDRQTYELRYTPMEKLMITSEYETGYNRNHEPKTELRDNIKMVQIRNEFYEGYIFDLTYEERDEDDVYTNDNDIFTRSKILGMQRIYNRWATMELGLQQNIVESKDPRKEWEKRLAVILTPFSRNQRYRFFINHKEITAATSGVHYEGGLNFSQFIGTDTIIDGEIKKVHASAGLVGKGYDALVLNAKMVITF